MTLAAGSTLGPYEIVAPIGAGGMGEVYRARDARLGREVAVKVLPASFTQDADRLRRFEQEARATSALNHPNILAIHDIGSDRGVPYVVSELLDGETLRERIGGTPMPVRKAIDLAAQIAKGLAAAHDKGIVHRDLKPDNVFVTRDGRVKILDFGLAKLLGIEDLTEGATTTGGAGHGTDAGKVLGTVGYMSPEQVRAQPVDPRSDIFSFGAVLYEMLAGERAFRGGSAVETLNAILKEDPPNLSNTNQQLPPALERIVTHCLEKNPEERFQSARDVAFDLEHLTGSSPGGPATTSVGGLRLWPRRLGLGVGGLALAAAAFVAGGRLGRPGMVSYHPITFRRGSVSSARFGPDGHTVIYSARWEGGHHETFTTQLGSPESHPLGMHGVGLVSVSSTGELALLSDGPNEVGGTLSRVPMGGGSPRDVLEGVVAADWSEDGSSLAVAVLPAGEAIHIEYPTGTRLYTAPSQIDWLRVSRHGDAVAFCEHPVAGDSRGSIAMVDRKGTHTTLADGFTDIGGVAWSTDDREIWFSAVRPSGAERQLYAVTRDRRLREVVQVPGSVVLQDINTAGEVILSLGPSRPMAVAMAPGGTAETSLSWLDFTILQDISRDGHLILFTEEGAGGGPGYGVYLRLTDGSPAVRLGKGLGLSLAPDCKRVLTLDLGTGQLVVLPSGAGASLTLPRGSLAAIHNAAFLPDGQRITLLGNEAGKPPRTWIQDLGGGPPRPLLPDGVVIDSPYAVTPDGAWVVAHGSEGPPRLYPLAGGEPRTLPGLEIDDMALQMSADGTSLFVRTPGVGRARIVRVDLKTARREDWKSIGPADLAGVVIVGRVMLTPDGKAYGYGYSRHLSTLYQVTGLK